ncbi:MAG TPA: methyltransferase domain-containing protein [Steroidobacteraceae bacterium]|nr:methyltransferase domain-containing protein [Steroidobacteraceae bacterium]
MNLRDAGYFTAGLGFLALAKAKHVLRGYSSPKPFDLSQTDRCVAYDTQVVRDWLRELARYSGGDTDLRGKDILELGPGSDLGVGLLLLAQGATSYNACDVHDLAKHAPPAFYEALFSSLSGAEGVNIATLREALRESLAGRPSRLNYVVRSDFDIAAAFGPATIDMVFSQAAFEHFDDIDAVVRRLTRVCRPGARIVAEIDLKTHSRWVRDHDPNNIYRFPDPLYNMFRFRGIPNRVRPYQYAQAFERNGWIDIQMRPLTEVQGANGVSTGGFSRRFRDEVNQMKHLTIALCARRPA